MDAEAVKRRIDAILSIDPPGREPSSSGSERGSQILYGTLSILDGVYGPESVQSIRFKNQLDKAVSESRGTPATYTWNLLTHAARGALLNLKAEIEADFVGSLQKKISGEILTDFIGLARAALEESSDSGKNVAAVLAAAAFEDTIRRLGSQFAGVIGRDDLVNVMDALKKSGILQAPQLGIALGYLNFRNHALHANWDQIQRESVQSVLGFVEELLLKHFA